MYEEERSPEWNKILDLAAITNAIQDRLTHETNLASLTGEEKHMHASNTLNELLGDINFALMPINSEVH